MDLDAIIARHPQIALVDELAHTNAPGSRHPKRYLDIEELLNRGIDVYTTVNIQHIESLNDVVAQITHVRVRETVPDSVFDRADAIELVDLTPDDLIERLKEGKVYVPKQAERALEHYFSPGNLTALRELALRRTAERVDEQLLTHMQAHAIPGPWAAGERILVCVSEDPRAAGLVRYAKRLADRLHAPFTAFYVETRRSLQWTRGGARPRRGHAAAGGGARRRGDHHSRRRPQHRGRRDQLRAGQQRHPDHHRQVGAVAMVRDPARLGGPRPGPAVRQYQRARHRRRRAGARSDPEEDACGRRKAQRPSTRGPMWWRWLAVAAALGVGELIQPLLGIENVDLVFLTAVVGVAVRYGLWPSLLATVASSLCYNFFFLPPIYTFTITDPTNLAAFVFFTVVAVVVSHFAARGRTQTVAAHERVRAVELLYAFSRKLAGVGTLDDVLWATAYQTALMLKVRVVLLLPEDGSIVVKAGYPPEDILDEADVAAAKWAWQNDRVAGRGSDTLPGAKRLFLPMRTGRGAIGVMGIDSDKTGPLLTPDQRRLLDALIDQAALAIERVYLVEDVDRAKRTIETDRLRSALLTSISHDLKTPLAAVLGAASTLRDLSSGLSDAEKADLLATVIDESERLNRFIANLLDMTKLESGAVVPNTALHDLGEIVGSALRRASKILARHQIELELAAGLPMLELDAVLFEQVLFNLLDNAAKYSPAGTTIRIRSWRDQDAVCLQVLDEGDGIPPGGPGAHLRQVLSGGKGRSGAGRHRDSVSRSRAASSKPCMGRSRRRTVPTGPARSSRSGCRCRRRPSNWTPRHERGSAQGPRRR